MMQAVVMQTSGSPDVLEYRSIKKPEITDSHHICIHIKAAGVNPIDTKLRQRGSFFPENNRIILGCDAAGIVESIGSGVTDFKSGDEVYYCYGGLGQSCGNYAEYAIVDSRYVAKKPKTLSFVEAAAAPLVLITAWESLFDRAKLQADQQVLIHAGAGGVGHVAIQLAKQAGAKVATTVSSDEKAALVTKLGADLVIHYQQESCVDAVLKWTEGRGVDLVLDSVGGKVFSESLTAICHYGHIVTLLQIPENIDWKEPRQRNLCVSQELMLTPMIHDIAGGAAHHADILETCATMFDDGILKVHVTKTVALSEVATAHRLIEQGSTLGKIVIDMAA